MTFNTVKTIKPCIISSEYETGAHSWRVQRSRFPRSHQHLLWIRPVWTSEDLMMFQLQRFWSISACSKNTILPDWSCCDDLKNQYSDNWFVTWVSDVFGLEFKLPLVFQRSLVNVIPDWFKHPGFSSTQMMEWKSDRVDASFTEQKSVLASWRSGSFLPSLCSCLTADGKGLFFWTRLQQQPVSLLTDCWGSVSPSDAQTGNLPDITVEINGSLFKHRRMNQLLTWNKNEIKWAEDDHSKHLFHPHRHFYF